MLGRHGARCGENAEEREEQMMKNITSSRRWITVLAVMVMATAWTALAADKPASPKTKADQKIARKQRKQKPAKRVRRVKPPTTKPAEATKAPTTKPARATKAPTTKPAEATVKPTIAHIALAGPVLASPPEFSLFAGQSQGVTLREWLQRLAKARNDDQVKAVALEIDSPRMNWAQAQELADAVHRLSAEKPVYAHIVSVDAVSYLVASAARELTMDPSGDLMITGVGTEMMFFRGTLDHIGIEPQMFQIGRYKGAAEPMTRTGPSKELKGEYGKILDDLYDQLCEQIAEQRDLTVPHVRYAVDNGPFSAKSARKYDLIDGMVERIQWKQHVVNKVLGTAKAETAMWASGYGVKQAKKLDLSNPFTFFGMLMGGKPTQATKDPTVAIIHAEGTISSGSSGSGMFGGKTIGHKTMIRCFQQAADDDNVKAVIFRIDSPGGSALASELIYQAVRQCARKKPVIASIVGVGASGGYYIALGANKIIADPSAITGSIGVVGGKMATTGLMNKLGISTFEITRGRNAGLWSSKPWDEREQGIVKTMMEETYRTFTSRVRQGRGSRVKNVADVAQGRVFTARQAVDNGLIDGIGGLREAVIAAQKAAKIKSSHILVLPQPKTLADLLTGSGASAETPMNVKGAAIRALIAEAPSILTAGRENRQGLSYLLTLGEMLGRECVLTAMPYHVSVRP